ncbi:hypothetical protein [Bradyrhizobium sp. ARR65]|uniref:hypothetical protein n=1 Tax=Bradyrhizobium sp. ARR65 TaxID=1040989 RepID=UPI000466F603|nr:hypothetical protein [Bradyrhizobium sp. ARR65]
MLTDAILHILHTLAQWRFLALFACIMLSLAAPSLPPFRPRADGQARFRSLIPLPLGIALGIGNLIFGPDVSAVLVHRFGTQGQATVTGSYDTGNSYNDRRVMGYKVLIKTADERTIQTSFEDDDFNVYPPANGVYYPQPGDVFNVSYIESFPEDFIIISNDDSPWAHALRCFELMSAVHEADGKQRFAPKSAEFRKSYEDALQTARAAGCEAAGSE